VRRLPISAALALGLVAGLALPLQGASAATKGLQPELGRSFVVALVSGDVFLKRPGAARATRLRGRRVIPVGTAVNTTKGRVKLVGALTRVRRSKGVFSQGAFIATQARRKRAVIDLELTGGNFGTCTAPARTALNSRIVRRLRGSAKGRFRTRGKHSAATVRGTKWLTADLCDTTEISTQEGIVDVAVASAEFPLGPGQEFAAYCDPPLDSGLEPNYCIAGLNSPNEGIFAVALGTRVHSGEYTLCVTAPAGQYICRPIPLPAPEEGTDFSISALGCAPDADPGTYLVEWYYAEELIGFMYIPVPNPFAPGTGFCPVTFEDLAALGGGSVSRQSLTSSARAGRSLARPPGASALFSTPPRG
jgi:hypothetical protein